MSIPNDLKLMNRRQVLLASLKSGPATRSALAQATGISRPTTGKIIEELIDDGVLRSTESMTPALAQRGRPGIFVKVDDVQQRFLGVQVSASFTRIRALPVAPMLRDVWAKTLPTGNSLIHWVEAVADAAKSFLRRPPAGLLVSVPGVLDHETGCTLLSPNLRWTEGHNLAALLGDAVRVPGLPVQEIQCLAYGHRAANPSEDNFILVDFGIGVGSAVIVRGRLLTGAMAFAGELGHTPVPSHTDLCACGGVGCLETLVGRRRLFDSCDPDCDADTLSPAEFEELKNPKTVARVQEGLEAAGFAIAAAMNVLGLDHAVLTGFVADLPPELFAVLRRAISASAIAARFGVVRVDAVPRHRLAGLASVGIDRIIVPA